MDDEYFDLRIDNKKFEILLNDFRTGKLKRIKEEILRKEKENKLREQREKEERKRKKKKKEEIPYEEDEYNRRALALNNGIYFDGNQGHFDYSGGNSKKINNYQHEKKVKPDKIIDEFGINQIKNNLNSTKEKKIIKILLI